MKVRYVVAVWAVCIVCASSYDLVRSPELTDPEEIADAKRLSAMTHKVAERIRQCQKQGGSHLSCLCQARPLMVMHTEMIRSVLAKYPHWLEKDGFVQYTDAQEKKHVIGARGLKKRAETPLPQCGQ